MNTELTMLLDASTMVVILALGNLALCALLTFFDHGTARAPALNVWSLSKQIQGGAWLLLALGDAGVVPAPLAVPGGYALLFAGVAIEAGASWELARRPGWRRPTLVAGALAILAFFLCYLVDEEGLRGLAASLLLGAFYLSGSVALAWRWGEASLLRRFLAVASGALALVVASRGLSVLFLQGGWGWMSNELLAQLSSGALYLLMLGNGFGMLLLARERLQEALARLETIDPLTDVPNRRGFFQALAPWMALARRPGLPTALVVLDLDQFKRINDGYGHPAGDAVLRHVVELTRRQLRDSDQLGRLVGVEFAILLPRTNLDEATLVAERIRAAIEATPVKSERALIRMTASFGVTTIRPEDSTTTLFGRADEALLQAKGEGRNRVARASAAPAEA
ncbi:GGDEF domain-containing protein [Massilia sp. YIM B02443]|uniref:GGDEF domain-containing protein n=1 Tax=Massilia sp. YIM B02443 TaxID=3050127 RepID=UPI0025B6EEB9|nr:GGDEF domain-containing protein [Massilia sp. YIM B02443]MDN4038250.1 GGDEF domain-containing protein [Massilia sp. YIM B02443]